MIKKVNKEGGKVTSVDATDNTENKDFKKTLKLTWLCVDEEKSAPTPAVVIYYDHIASMPILDKDDDFKSFVDKDTKVEIEMIGDPELRNLKKGDVVQIQRRGYFICDVEYRTFNPAVGRARPVVLIAIPDGTPGSYGPPGKAQPATTKAPAKGGKKEAAKAKKPAAPASQPSQGSGGDDISAKVAAQGDKVRQLKADKAGKEQVQEAVKALLQLKEEYKAATGKDWQPASGGGAPAKSKSDKPSGGNGEEISAKVAAQGEKVRQLKADKAGKEQVHEAVKALLQLKEEYKAATGKDWQPASGG